MEAGGPSERLLGREPTRQLPRDVRPARAEAADVSSLLLVPPNRARW